MRQRRAEGALDKASQDELQQLRQTVRDLMQQARPPRAGFDLAGAEAQLESLHTKLQTLGDELPDLLIAFEKAHREHRRLAYDARHTAESAAAVARLEAQAKAVKQQADETQSRIRRMIQEHGATRHQAEGMARRIERRRQLDARHTVRAARPDPLTTPTDTAVRPLRFVLLSVGSATPDRMDWRTAANWIADQPTPGVNWVPHDQTVAATQAITLIDPDRFALSEQIRLGRSLEADAVITIGKTPQKRSTHITAIDPHTGLLLSEVYSARGRYDERRNTILRHAVAQTAAWLRQPAPADERPILVVSTQPHPDTPAAKPLAHEPLLYLMRLRLMERGVLAIDQRHTDALASHDELNDLGVQIGRRSSRLELAVKAELDATRFRVTFRDRSRSQPDLVLQDDCPVAIAQLAIDRLVPDQQGDPIPPLPNDVMAEAIDSFAQQFWRSDQSRRLVLAEVLAWQLGPDPRLTSALAKRWVSVFRRPLADPAHRFDLHQKLLRTGLEEIRTAQIQTLISSLKKPVPPYAHDFPSTLHPFSKDGSNPGLNADARQAIMAIDDLSIARLSWPNGNPGPDAYLNRARLIQALGPDREARRQALIDGALAALYLDPQQLEASTHHAASVSTASDWIIRSQRRNRSHRQELHNNDWPPELADPWIDILLRSPHPDLWAPAAIARVQQPDHPDREALARRVAVQHANTPRTSYPHAQWRSRLGLDFDTQAMAVFAQTLAGRLQDDPQHVLNQDASVLNDFVKHLPDEEVGGVYRFLKTLHAATDPDKRKPIASLIAKFEPRHWKAEPDQAPPDSTKFWALHRVHTRTTDERSSPIAMDALYAKAFRDQPEGMLLLCVSPKPPRTTDTPDRRADPPTPTVSLAWIPVHGGDYQTLQQAPLERPLSQLIVLGSTAYAVGQNELLAFKPDGIERIPHPDPAGGPIQQVGQVNHHLLIHYGQSLGWLDLKTRTFTNVSRPDSTHFRNRLDRRRVSYLDDPILDAHGQSLIAHVSAQRPAGGLYRFDPRQPLEPTQVTDRSQPLSPVLGKITFQRQDRVAVIDTSDPQATQIHWRPLKDLHPLWPDHITLLSEAAELSDGTLVIAHRSAILILTPQGEYARLEDWGRNRIIPRGPHPPVLFFSNYRIGYYHLVEVTPKLPDNLQ
ncbi:MAG: hypothetical protein AAF750_05970 [Planctomycetota bacterium]